MHLNSLTFADCNGMGTRLHLISAPVEFSFPSFSTKLETIGWDDIHARDATCHRLLHEARDPCAASTTTTYRKVLRPPSRLKFQQASMGEVVDNA